jgi:DNA modification methylase
MRDPVAILHQGPADQMLREHVATGSIDLVYADPPYGNGKQWVGTAGRFSDRHRDSGASRDGWATLAAHAPQGVELIRIVARTEQRRAYLGVMAGILLEVRRVMKFTATLWLQFDDVMGAELRLLCDVVFGAQNAIGLVFWKRTSAHSNARCFGRTKDTIAVYGRSRAARWRLARLKSDLVHGDPCTGAWVEGLIEERLTATSNERVGYPTQKPVALLERIVLAASLPGGVVLDPTCGSATTLVAAIGLNRSAVGIDISEDALAVARERLAGQAAATERAKAQLDLFGAVA